MMNNLCLNLAKHFSKILQADFPILSHVISSKGPRDNDIHDIGHISLTNLHQRLLLITTAVEDILIF